MTARMHTRLRSAALLLAAAFALFAPCRFACAESATPIAAPAFAPVPAPFKSWLLTRFMTEKDGAQARDILQFMQSYSMHPAPSSIPDFLQEVDASAFLDKHQSAFALMSGFICRLAEMNPEFIHTWFKAQHGDAAPYGAKTMAMLQYAIWRAGHLNDAAIAKFFTEKPAYLSTTPGTLAASALRTPDDVDMMWGAFLSSGDVFFADKIIDAFITPPPDMKPPAQNALAFAAASSLRANALNHDIVLRALEQHLEKAQDDATRKRLDALLPQTTPGRSFAVHDGNFGAEIIAAPLGDIMAQIEKPADAQLTFPRTLRVARGEKIGVLIVFSGMSLNDALQADVDFDMAMTAPDGTTETGSVLTRKTAIDGRLQSRFAVLHTPSFLGVEFTPQDALGAYTLNATLRDNVSGRALSLRTHIELTDAPTQQTPAPKNKPSAPQKQPVDYGTLNR